MLAAPSIRSPVRSKPKRKPARGSRRKRLSSRDDRAAAPGQRRGDNPGGLAFPGGSWGSWGERRSYYKARGRRLRPLAAFLRVVLGLNLLLLLLLHYGPGSAVIGYVLPHPRHFD